MAPDDRLLNLSLACTGATGTSDRGSILNRISSIMFNGRDVSANFVLSNPSIHIRMIVSRQSETRKRGAHWTYDQHPHSRAC